MKTWYLKAKSVVSMSTLAGAMLAAPLVLDKVSDALGSNVGFSSALYAQAAKDEKKQTRRLPGISEKVFKGLGKVSAYVNPDIEKDPKAKPDLKKAYKELKKVEKQCAECNNYEKSQIYQMFAYVAYSLENYAEAISYYKKVIQQSPEIPIGVELSSLMYVAQLSFQIEKYDDAIEYFDKRVKLSEESGNELGPQDWQFKAIICYQGGRKKCAFDNISKAISMVEAKGKVAEESWYNIQRSLYLEEEKYKPATGVLEKLVRHYPKKSYWSQLGSMYGLLERSDDQLHAMDTTYLMGGFTKEKQLINLGYLYMADEVPYRAAFIIDKGMNDKVIERSEKNLEVLAKAWQMAKEPKKAIPVLQELGKVSKSGNAYGELVGVYLDLNQPKSAIKAGKQAIKKGNFKREADGEVHINMGIAYFDTRQYSAAIESFRKASKIKKHAKFARSWQRYSEGEKLRYDGLKRSLASVGLDIEKVIQ